MRIDVKSDYKLGSFSAAGCAPFAGLVLNDEQVIALSALTQTARLTGTATLLDFLQDWTENSAALRKIVPLLRAQAASFPFTPVSALRVHAPLAPPTIVCAGFNYRKHVLDWYEDPAERASMAEKLDARARSHLSFVFSKSSSAVTAPVTQVALPVDAKDVDWEIELVAVIGHTARRVSRADALGYVAGYTVGNDISSRDLMFRNDVSPGLIDFFGCKSSPGYCPLGPFIVPAEFIPDPQALWLQLKLNGKIMQDEGSQDMIDSVAKLIEYASSRTTLRPGDILMTGSPSGNAKMHGNRYLRPGDLIESEIFGIGRQTIRFAAEAENLAARAV